MASIAAGAGLIERGAELGRGSALVDDALDARGRCALLAGPAGIGKSRLLAEIAGRGHDAGMRVLRARATELERDFPYGVVRQLLERPLLSATAQEREILLEGAAGLAGPVFGLAPAGMPTPPGDQAFAAAHGLYWLAVGLAARQPLLLAVDDLQWSDAPSLRWLAYLARRLEGVPLLLLAAVREGESEPSGVLDALARDPESTTIRPASLSPDGVATFVTTRVAGAEHGFSAAAHTITGGNPFYLGELLEAALAAGVPPTAASASALAALGPANVAASVLRRVRRHGPEAERLAQAFAVLDSDASLRRAGELARVPDETAVTLVDRLVDGQILAAGRGFEFVHPVVRAAVYQAIPPAENLRLHSAAVSLLDVAGVEPDRIARHVMLTEPGEHPALVETMRAAAAEAVRRGAPDVAARYLQRALDEARATADQATIMHELGEAQLANRDPAAFEHLEGAIALATDTERRDLWSLHLARAYGVAARPADSVAFARAALERGIADPVIALKLESELLGNAWLTAYATDDALARLERLERADVPPELASYVELHRALRLTSDCAPSADALALAERALLSGVLLESDSSLPFIVLITMVWNDDLERPQQLCNAAVALAQQMGSQHLMVNGSAFGGLAALRAGSLAEAAASAGAAYEFASESAMPGSVDWAWTLSIMIDAMCGRGELQAADDLMRDAGAEGDLSPDHVTFLFLLESRGRLRCALGRTAEGLADLLAAGEGWGAFGQRNPNVSSWRSEAARAMLALGDRAGAAALVAEELELARAAGTARGIGVALTTAGMLGRDVDALAEAVDVLRCSPARLELAHALAELGIAHRQAGSAAAARDPLAEALDLAQRCTAAPLAQRVREELSAVGARPRRDYIQGVESLTPSELRVAVLASEGRTNKAIAQALFLTLRTVETHLTHVYRKLDIGSRAALREAFANWQEAA